MDRKSFKPTDLKLSEEGVIEAAFAQLNVVDHDGDLTIPGAFAAKEVPMSAYGHTSWDGALPVGKGTISERGDWAVFSGQFFMETTHGRDAYQTVKALGSLAEYSYGFNVRDSAPGVHEGKNVRVLKALDVFEVSPVLMGAGIGTHTLAIKSGGPVADSPWSEHILWYAEGLPALVKRAHDRRDFRAVDERKLSRTDRARLQDIEAALPGLLEAVRELLFVPDAPPAEEAPKSVSLEVQLAIARRLGVKLPD